MTYSYTQISQYLACPRRYRHRYLDGWKEKDTRGAMLFGRAFELALGAYFRREDPGEVFFREWLLYKEQNLIFSKHDSWDRMQQRAIMLLIRFARTTGSESVRPTPICRRNSRKRQGRMSSSAISMASEHWTASAVCWNGRQRQVATQE